MRICAIAAGSHLSAAVEQAAAIYGCVVNWKSRAEYPTADKALSLVPYEEIVALGSFERLEQGYRWTVLVAGTDGTNLISRTAPDPDADGAAQKLFALVHQLMQARHRPLLPVRRSAVIPLRRQKSFPDKEHRPSTMEIRMAPVGDAESPDAPHLQRPNAGDLIIPKEEAMEIRRRARSLLRAARIKSE